ncbi:ATP-dependent DNA helicase pif1 [Gracilariopsis chorda]|uniref:ATP-dependent DNA helicase pif1 n=1 Tax=Gracilariopsis chorda TaxID=448386 RepID=A0A2V3IR80_9FLOR|nr:ATP-dependent DNA helicase pif1 [Gracilariopsis chorda]|eukprot:PXF44603.1 ATP-dependent DNA helicase pif1 [Gracilariopsis chorda]
MMLLRNLDPSTGHVNGALYTVEDMQSNVLFLPLASGVNRGNPLCLPRMPCGPGDDNFPVPNFTRTQFPVRVCFAITTNKAQGQSYSGRIGLDLRDGCFTHGQLYIAFSRTTNPSNIVACLPAGSTSTNNVLYHEVLS